MFTSHLIVAGCLLLSLVSGYLNWSMPFTGISLLVAFSFVVRLIPTMLNLSRSFFLWIIFDFIIFILVIIIAFALHHKSTGLLGMGGAFEPSFHDAIYFSVTTFTTLGYGDIQPLPEMRLATSIQALAGMFSVALASAVIFLWCQDHLVPHDMAFFDANRRHKKGIGISRIRVRTISGKERNLSDWVLPPQEGEVLYHDQRRGEWLTVNADTEIPDNALVVRPIVESREANVG